MRVFTPREKEILQLIAERGLSDKEIARELGIAVDTVGCHVQNIRNRIKGSLNLLSLSRIDIALYAIANGYASAKALDQKYLVSQVERTQGVSLCHV